MKTINDVPTKLVITDRFYKPGEIEIIYLTEEERKSMLEDALQDGCEWWETDVIQGYETNTNRIQII